MTTHKKTLAAAIALISAGGHAYAQSPEQQVRVDVEQVEGSQYRASIIYRPSNNLATTGLGLRLHYSSALISDINISDSLMAGSLTNGTITTVADTSDLDSLPATNFFLNSSWADFNGNWPPSPAQDTVLYRFTFTLNNPSAPQTIPMNFTASSFASAAGFAFAPTNFDGRLPDIYLAPSGTDNQITIAEDVSYTLTADDFGFSDPDDPVANSFIAVKINSLPTNGALALNDIDVSVGQEIAVTDLTGLVFSPDADRHGPAISAFTFQVRDNGADAITGKAGSIDLDATPNTISFNVSSVNDAPRGEDNAVNLLEDTSYTFAAGDFGFADPGDDPAHELDAVIITSLPALGTLRLNGIAVTQAQQIPAGQIDLLTYTPPADANGNAYAALNFKVKDNGGLDNGGQDTDLISRTMTLNVTAVNDQPSTADRGLSILEGGSHTFSANNFGFADTQDTPPDDLEAVLITGVPAVGTLTLSASQVVNGQTIPAAQLGNLVYTPGTGPGVNVSTLMFRVRDSGGTANGGQNESAAPGIITFSVTDINSAPSGADNVVSAFENSSVSFSAADFGFNDDGDTPANTLQAVIISSLPASGALTLNNVAVTAGQIIPVASIPQLAFAPARDGNGDAYASFTFRVQDDGGTLDGGEDTDPVARTLSIDVQPVNSAPASADRSITLFEDDNYEFSSADFVFNDSNDMPADSLAAIIIESLPSSGSLTLNNMGVVAGQSIAANNIGALTFTPVANQSGSAYASFSFRVQDSGGTANGGVDVATASNTISIAVTPLNDAPAAEDATLIMNENTSKSFVESDFGFSDSLDDPADLLAGIIVESLPEAGILTVNSLPVTVGQEIAADDFASLLFTPDPHQNGSAYTSFTYRVKDNGGTQHAGDSDTSIMPNTLTFDVVPVNSAPMGIDKTETILEAGTYTFTVEDFGFSDPNDNPANTLSGVRITTLPALGTLKLDDVAIAAEQVVALDDIVNLTYQPVAHGNGESYAQFTFQVQDNGGTADGGSEFDQTARTFTFNVTPVNSAPSGANRTVTAPVNGDYTFSAANFGFTDVNDNPANTLLEIIMVTVPDAEQGELTLAGEAVTAGQVIAVADIPDLVYTPPENVEQQPFASFTFRVRDNGGTENGGIDTDAIARTMTLNVGFPPPPPEPDSNTPPQQVTDAVDEINDQLDEIIVEAGQPVSADTVNQVNDALDRASELAEQVTNNLPEGAAGVTTALTTLDTLTKTLAVTSSVTQNGGAITTTAAVNSISNVANVMSALATRTQDITPEQRATVQTLTTNTMSSSANLITDNTSTADLVSVVAATSAVINAASAAGGQLTQALVTQAEELVSKAVKTGMKSFASDIDVEDPEAVAQLLSTNQAALEFAVEASIAVQSSLKASDDDIDAELNNRGIDANVSESLRTVLSGISNPDGVSLGDTTASQVLLDALVQFLTGGASNLVTQDGRIAMALSTGNIELTTDPLTGTVLISAPGEKYAGAIAGTRIVSSAMPNGMSYLRDGRLLIVSNGVAIELAPVAADVIGFTAAIQQEGYQMTLRDDVSVEITLSPAEKFVGVFAYDNIINTSGQCGVVSISEPAGALNAPGYAFGVNCANGVQQRVLPYVQNRSFYRSVAAMGLTMTTDRSTGIITIPGVGRFKPSFFVSAPTPADDAYFEANKDAQGVAFRFVDLMGTGDGDVLFYTEDGVQAIYQVND